MTIYDYLLHITYIYFLILNVYPLDSEISTKTHEYVKGRRTKKSSFCIKFVKKKLIIYSKLFTR